MSTKKEKLHEAICADLTLTYRNKDHDYGNSFGETFQKLGIISAVTRISDKTNRLQTLATKTAKVTDEKIEDTLMDLANYAILTLIEIELEKEKQRDDLDNPYIGRGRQLTFSDHLKEKEDANGSV